MHPGGPAEEGAPFVTVVPPLATTETESKPIHRNVYVYINVFAISDIVTAAETFNAQFYLKASWVEPGLKPGQPLSTDAWKPSIMFMNAVGNPGIEDEDFGVVKWRLGPDGSAVVQWSAKFQGTFREQFELRSFPFDVQPLSIVITSQQKHVRLYEDKFDGVQSKLRDEYMSLPEFSLVGPLFRPRPELALGKYASMSVDFVATRKFPYHIFNIYFPLFLLTGMLFCSFAVDPSEAADRLSLTLTVVLASVAYKYIVSQDLPRISYLTLCDLYVLGNFSFAALFVFEHVQVGLVAKDNTVLAQAQDDDWYIALLAIFLGYHVIYTLAALFSYFRERRKGALACSAVAAGKKDAEIRHGVP
jgi:hypothetical protein